MLMNTNYQHDDLRMLANNGFWEQFHHDFEVHTSHIDDLSEWTQMAMFVLHLQLLNYSEYQRVLIKAKNKIIKNNNLVIPIFKNDLLRVNVLAIKAENNLPLHDHPGSSGSMLVISGKVRATVCEQNKLTDITNQSRCMLSVVENKMFSTGETSCFTQDQQNIHSFEAVTDRAVVMAIHTPPFTAEQQSFFFTAPPLQKVGSQVPAQRVRVQAFQKFPKASTPSKG